MKETLTSVGIDVGTSTSQVVFSRLVMADTAGFFSVPKVDIVQKEVFYAGRVHPTPLIDADTIDAEALGAIVEEEFGRAGMAGKAADTGAVIITGEAARKENARAVLDTLSGLAGDFVVSTAGPDLEAEIAGKGSGAQRFSQQNACTALNLDIGGGTSNLAFFSAGRTAALGSFDIGGRLVRVEGGRVAAVSPPAARVAAWKGLALRAGDAAEEGVLQALCQGMAEVLEMALGLAEARPILRQLLTPGASFFQPPAPIEALFLSGGVADAVYRPPAQPFQYGDIGVLLGRAIRQSRLCSALRLHPAGETIRATVVGAGSYTLKLSGSTIYYRGGVFPQKNLPVLCLTAEEERGCFGGDADMLAGRMRWFLGQNAAEALALAMGGAQGLGYTALSAAAGAIAAAAGQALPAGMPLVVVMERDMAKALGQLTAARLADERPLMVLDAIRAAANAYLDIGAPVMDGLVVPVVVKTLIFG